MAFLTDTFSARGSFTQKASALYARFIEAAAKRAVYKQTYRELNALSSRELADLGMHHSMIRRVAYQAAYEN